jgi:hypothetical protein
MPREGRHMSTPETQHGPGDADHHPDAQERRGLEESAKPTVSKPGGFKNDPDDPTNPNEAIERSRRRVKP